MKNSSLNCINLSKYYSHRMIFNDLDLTLSHGDSIGITGKNGSGKSSLVKILAGIISATGGEIELKVDDKKLSIDDQHKHIGFMSPYLNLYDELSGYENLSFFMNLKCPLKTEIEKVEKINFLLENVGLYKRQNDFYKNYSSGMKQRLKLAFALLNDPALLILDEPCANLDTEGIDVVYRFSDEQRRKGMLIIATNEEADLQHCDTNINVEGYKNTIIL